MSRSRPYQPLLLRLIHGVNGLVAVLAIISSFLVYEIYDGRLVKLYLPQIPNIIGLHGTFGLILLLWMPLMAWYSFHGGANRLIQTNSLNKLSEFGKPVWWYSLHRLVNTLILIATTWALITGRQMKEEWLPAGELDRLPYYLHLSSWIILVVCIGLHVFISLRVGGVPLIVSMFSWGYRPGDSPRAWLKKIPRWKKK